MRDPIIKTLCRTDVLTRPTSASEVDILKKEGGEKQ